MYKGQDIQSLVGAQGDRGARVVCAEESDDGFAHRLRAAEGEHVLLSHAHVGEFGAPGTGLQAPGTCANAGGDWGERVGGLFFTFGKTFLAKRSASFR